MPMWVRQELSPENVGQLACDRNVTDDHRDAAIAIIFSIGSGVSTIDTTGTISCSYVVIQHDNQGHWEVRPDNIMLNSHIFEATQPMGILKQTILRPRIHLGPVSCSLLPCRNPFMLLMLVQSQRTYSIIDSSMFLPQKLFFELSHHV